MALGLPRRRPIVQTFVPVIALVALLVAAGPAFAHGEDESTESRQLVLEAIALIIDEPDGHEVILDKIEDAQAAKDTRGVDLTLVRRAQDALDTEDVHRTRSLLERSIGARPHRGEGEPAPIREVSRPAKGAEPGQALPSDPLPGREGFDGGDWLVLVGFAALGLLGAALAVRFRPHPTETPR